MAGFFDFLIALSKNNNRPWFEENRNWFDSSKSGVEAIIEKCILEIGKFEDLGDLQAKKTMFRIYRDVRFAKNKEPYKKNFSAMLAKAGKKEMQGYGYYLHFQPDECFMASGIYEPSPEQLSKIRQEIDYNATELKHIIFEPSFVKMFGKMEGKQLKTSPKGYDKTHPEIELLRYTQFYFSTPFTEKETLSTDFPGKLAKACLKIRPFLAFMNKALD